MLRLQRTEPKNKYGKGRIDTGMASGPASRSLKYLRKEGWHLVQVVEQWIPQARRRRDLFGFADILAVHEDWGHLYVQTTSGSNFLARINKCLEAEAVKIILQGENRVVVHGWRKLKRNGRKIWIPRIAEIKIDEFGALYYEEKEV